MATYSSEITFSTSVAALFGVLVGPTGEVMACEPLDAVADALERIVAENHFGDRVTLYRVALDAHSGTVLLRHAPFTVNQGAADLAPHTAIPPDHVDVSVPTKTVDDIVASGPCAFIKLEAEGAELRILSGAGHTLTRCRPIILAELKPTLLDRVGRNCPTDVIAKMSALVTARDSSKVHRNRSTALTVRRASISCSRLSRRTPRADSLNTDGAPPVRGACRRSAARA